MDEKTKRRHEKYSEMFRSKIGGTLAFNEMASVIEIDGQPLDEGLRSNIDLAMLYAGQSVRFTNSMVLSEAYANRYNPIRQYFENLPDWDSVYSPISALCDCLKTNEDEYTNTIVTRWIINAVEKVLRVRNDFSSHQNPVLVLTGGQGLGKSSLARWLGSPLSEEYFTEGPLNPESTEHKRLACSKFIWEVSEVGASTRKSDVEALKSFLTTKEFSFRVPYAKDIVHAPSRCNYIATYNPSSGFLNDPTGHRRWAIVDLFGIDFSYSQIDPDELWAEAYTRLLSGDIPEITPDVQETLSAKAGSHEVDDPTLEYLSTYFVPDPEGEMLLTDVLTTLDAYGIKLHHSPAQAARVLTPALIRFGCIMSRKRIGNQRLRSWRGIRAK